VHICVFIAYNELRIALKDCEYFYSLGMIHGCL
jgi:hypothetical protein